MKTQNLQYQRKLEAKILFESISPYLARDSKILEIGSGDGHQVEYLSAFGSVFLLDLVIPKQVKGYFTVGNGEQLPFKKSAFDIIFTSHVVEHLYNKEKFFIETRRVAKTDAYYIHVVPTQVWKFLADLDYYPLTIFNGIKKILGHQSLSTKYTNESGNHGSSKPSFFRILKSKLLPPIHGTSKNLIEEYQNFEPQAWRKCFLKNGFKIVEEFPLLTYSPPELMLVPPNRFLARLGFPSSVAFLLK